MSIKKELGQDMQAGRIASQVTAWEASEFFGIGLQARSFHVINAEQSLFAGQVLAPEGGAILTPRDNGSAVKGCVSHFFVNAKP